MSEEPGDEEWSFLETAKEIYKRKTAVDPIDKELTLLLFEGVDKVLELREQIVQVRDELTCIKRELERLRQLEFTF